MGIPFNKFEQLIDEKILQRGLSYFKKGTITDFAQLSNSRYEALVLGSEEYVVELEVVHDTITEHHCNCPYDLGPICKHVVATLFYLQKDVLLLDEKPASKQRQKRTKSVAQQIKELLKTIPHEELIAFIEEKSKSDRKFRSAFLASFGHLSKDQSKAFYQKQIQSVLKSAIGRNGWIDWSNMRYVVNTTQPFLTHAEKYLAANNFQNVFFISTVLIEEFTEAFQYADDSNGDLGYFIASAMELLFELTQKKLPKPLKKEFFEYCLSAFQQNLFEGWDWHLDMLKIACELVEKEDEADYILKNLDGITGPYEKNRAQTFKLKILRRFKSAQEVTAYINKYIANADIRKKEIEIAFRAKNFERVIALSEDGIQHDAKEKPGLVKVWYNWLLKVAQYQKNSANIIAYARFLFIDNFYPEQDYYQILKDTVDERHWLPFLEELIKEITPKTGWNYTELLREVYIREAWWDRLFLMVKQNCSLNNIEQNEQYLSKEYSSELIELYQERITNYLENNMGRNHYRTACRYLRRMKKLGGGQQVIVLTELLRKKYPKRKALQDELNHI